MGHGIAFIVSTCWIALAMTLASALLVRFAVTRKVGVVLRWPAFAVYVIGFLGVILLYLDMTRGGEMLLLAFVLAAIATGIPLATCSVVFFKLFHARKGTAMAPAAIKDIP